MFRFSSVIPANDTGGADLTEGTQPPQDTQPAQGGMAGFSQLDQPCPGIPLTILQEDVEQDDADLVIGADVAIQQDGDNGPHGVLDLLSFSIGAHGQVLQGARAHPHCILGGGSCSPGVPVGMWGWGMFGTCSTRQSLSTVPW